MKTTTSGTIIQPVKVRTYQKPLPWLEAEDWAAAGLLFTTLLVSLCTWCSRVCTLLSRSTRDGETWPPLNVSNILYGIIPHARNNGILYNLHTMSYFWCEFIRVYREGMIQVKFSTTIKRDLYARDKFMRICQNGPLDKFMWLLFMQSSVLCIVTYSAIKIYAV